MNDQQTKTTYFAMLLRTECIDGMHYSVWRLADGRIVMRHETGSAATFPVIIPVSDT